jgi:hypothetical protein
MQIVTEGSVVPGVQVWATAFWLRIKSNAKHGRTNERVDMGAPELRSGGRGYMDAECGT